MSSQPSNKLSSINRFITGFFIGLFVAGLFWFNTIYLHVSISLVQGMIGSLLLAICCGTIATISGLDKIFDNLPSL